MNLRPSIKKLKVLATKFGDNIQIALLHHFDSGNETLFEYRITDSWGTLYSTDTHESVSMAFSVLEKISNLGYNERQKYKLSSN